jgi:hypothetical protein
VLYTPAADIASARHRYDTPLLLLLLVPCAVLALCTFTHSSMEHVIEPIRPYGMLLAGGLFGAGWWAWCDVLLRSSLVLHTKVSPLYCIPGIVATIAVILMAVINREDTDSYIGYDDDGEQVGTAVDAEAWQGSICCTFACMHTCCRRHRFTAVITAAH